MLGFHGYDLIIILAIVLLIFGPKKLPQIGSAIARSIKEYREGMQELTQPVAEAEGKTPPSAAEEAQKVVSSEQSE